MSRSAHHVNRNSWLRRIGSALAAGAMVFAGLQAVAHTSGGPNLAAGQAATASSENGPYVAGNISDGDQGSYWESTNGAFPQWASVDLGANTSIDQVVLKLPSGWESRTQTLSVQGSADGAGLTTIVPSDTYTFSPGSANTVVIDFPEISVRHLRVDITANSGWSAGQLSELEVYAADGATGDNLAQGRPTSESGHADVYSSANAVDGDQSTYWESSNGSFPQWIQVDLGATVGVNQLNLALPVSGWEARTQTLEVKGSTDGSSFTTLVASDDYEFDPESGNSVTIEFATTNTRFVRLEFTANTAWPAGQVSELEVYGPSDGDTEPPSAPENLSYDQVSATEIELSWDASTDNEGVAAYDIYANDELLTSVESSVLTYLDTRPAAETVTYYVRARDAAGNESPNSDTVTREGDTGDTEPPSAPTNLGYSQPSATEIELSWDAATDNEGVAAYDVYLGGELLDSVDGDTLTYTDTQPASATVTYVVRARDAAGNESSDSNSVTRVGDGGDTTNLAVGKPITASSFMHVFTADNANDDDVTTYWEGASDVSSSTLTVELGADATVDQVVVKLDPDPAWGARTQTFEILGRDQDGGPFATLVASDDYDFDPASDNTVTVPVSATVADVRLEFTANTGAPNGQVAELQVMGTPAPNPDLVVSDVDWTPSEPVETDDIALTATVENIGDVASAPSSVAFELDGEVVGTAEVSGISAGDAATASVDIGPRHAGDYIVGAVADSDGDVVERDEANNAYEHPDHLTVAAVSSSDLVIDSVSWAPDSPADGDTVDFSVTLGNQGTVASTSGPHDVTLTVEDANTGQIVETLQVTHPETIASGATTDALGMGSWTASDGRYTTTVEVSVDGNELPIKQGNNTSTRSLFVGRGADMPYITVEAEDGETGGGAQIVGPNRTIGDPAGEASGRQAVMLDATGEFVEFTTTASTNTLVTRFVIPDAPGGGGIDATLNVYVDGEFLMPIDLTSRFAWVYGAEANPGNSPGQGPPRHIYDEANILLDSAVPAGSTIRLQKDESNTADYYGIDFVSFEQVAPEPNPDPERYVEPNGFTHQDVQSALDQVRMDTSGDLLGVYLPAGDYDTSQKFQVYGKPVEIVGAGPWYTRFYAPQGQENTDVGFRAEASANGSTFSGFAYFGNYTIRRDGPGKVFDWQNVSDMTIDDIWVEHQVVMLWGAQVSDLTITNSRTRNLWADALNMTNGSTGNLVSNVEARASGDDSFALFAATDLGGGDQTGNVYENLTSILTWRAAGLAVYGGYGNTFRNIHIADTLVYSGVTVGSLDFGIPMDGFGAEPPTTFENISIVRAGGHFWGAQTFPGMWIFSADKAFQGIRVTDVDIVDPTYSGIMFQTGYSGGEPLNPVTDTVFTNVSISGAQLSGDEFEEKSGFGIWVNEMPEEGQGPAVGSAVFNNLTFSDNHQNIKNTTSTFDLVIND